MTTVDDVHTCSSSSGGLVSQHIKRAETCKLKFLAEALPKLMLIDQKTSTRNIIQVVKKTYGQEIALRQAQKVKAFLVTKSNNCRTCSASHHPNKPCVQSPRPPVEPLASICCSGTTPDSPSEDGVEEDQVVTEITTRQPEQANQRDTTFVSNSSLVIPSKRSKLPPILRSNLPLPPLSNTAREQINNIVIDPKLSTSHQVAPSSVPNMHSELLRTVLRPSVASRSTAPNTNQLAAKTSQEIRMEAAKLMQNAARLMQEAARMNAEAARLTASVASS